MDEKEVYRLLNKILQELEEVSLSWRLDGSVNLLVQGMDLKPNDLDIATNSKGLEIFYGLFKEFVVDDQLGEVASGRVLKLDIDGREVEINSYTDKELTKLDKIQFLNWKDLSLPVLPLKEAKKFYQKINREEKVKMIVDQLKINKK